MFNDWSEKTVQIVFHKLVIVVVDDTKGNLYIDDAKAFSSRIRHSINGAHICLFAEEGSAEFTNITMKLPQ